MTSAITIGRFGLDIETTEIDTWDMDGNRVRVAGEIFATDVASALAARQQVLGLAESTYPVPVTWADDRTQDGYYRVMSTSVPTGELTLSNGLLPWSAILERPRGFSSMRPEILVSGTDRASKPVGITASHWVGVPSGYGIGAASGTPSLDARYLVGGSPHVVYAYGSVLAPRNNLQLNGPMSAFYTGACTTKMGDPLYTVIGRQYAQSVEDWAMTNGLVTVSPGTSTEAIFSIQVQNPVGGASVPPTLTYEIELGRFVGGTWTDSTNHTVTSVQLLRETVDEQVLRISGVVNMDSSTFTRNVFIVDLSLRRGALGVDLMYRFSQADKYGLGWVSAVASSTISAENTGFYKTSADADGMSPTIIHPPSGFIGAFTRDLTNGRCYFTGAGYKAASFWVGLAYNSAASSDAATLQDEYFSTVRTTQRVVAA